jgi:hypothetical protein
MDNNAIIIKTNKQYNIIKMLYNEIKKTDQHTNAQNKKILIM